MRSRRARALGLLCAGVWACGDTGEGSTSGDPEAPPQGTEIGNGDGSAESVELTEIHVLTKTTRGDPEPVDLAFNPADPGELWVIAYGDDSVHVGYVDGEGKEWTRYVDPAESHFMAKPTAMAMGESPFWASCGNTDNGQNDKPRRSGTDGEGNLFMGPALWTTDLTIFATRATDLGSHYDMLHNSPFCRGIAHVEKNAYWVFNAYDSSLDRYDFHEDHGPGNDDHSDGEIFKYVVGEVLGEDDTPSHVFYDPTDRMLYVADTGHGRIARLDTTKGEKTGELPRRNEPLAASGVMGGVSLEDVVAPGVLEKPSGIEVKDGLVYVTDTATSTFYVFDKSGKQQRRLATDLPPGSLAGFTFGHDGKIWFTDRIGGRVMRIDTKPTSP